VSSRHSEAHDGNLTETQVKKNGELVKGGPRKKAQQEFTGRLNSETRKRGRGHQEVTLMGRRGPHFWGNVGMEHGKH